MIIYNLLRAEQADIAEELRRGRSPAIKPRLYGGLQGLPLVGPGVQMEYLGVEFTPDFLDGIEPGRVGRQGYEGDLLPRSAASTSAC